MKNPVLVTGIALSFLIGCSGSTREDKAVSRTVDLEVPREESTPEPTAAADAESDKNGDIMNTSDSWTILGGSGLASTFAVANEASVGSAISSSAARQGTDTTHRFIRTADLRFRVKNVIKATLRIEDIVGAHHGWVAKTELRSDPQGQDFIPVSPDSTLEISRYEMVNELTLRVPNAELDSTLRAIGRLVDLFDHRTINADDISLDMMRNAMAVRRAKAHSIRVTSAINAQGKKLKETLTAEEALQTSDERRDNALLANMDLADRVAFSTVKLEVYQRTLVRRELIANERNIDGYQPSLLNRIGSALKSGWQLLESLVIGVLNIWPLIAVLLALFIVWRRMAKKRKPSA